MSDEKSGVDKTANERLGKEELLDEIGEAFAGGVYTQLKEIVEEHFNIRILQLVKKIGIEVTAQQKPTVTRTEIENAVGDTSEEYIEGVVELFEEKGFTVEMGK